MGTLTRRLHLQGMLRLMLLIEGRDGYRAEVVTPAPWRFWCRLEAELYVWYGPGPVARIPLADGGALLVFREDVETMCAWSP